MSKFFAYDPVDGASFFGDEEAARKQAQDWLDEERANSGDGWSEEVSGICWGEVCGEVVQAKNEPAPDGSEFDYIADYALRDVAALRPYLAPVGVEAFEGLRREHTPMCRLYYATGGSAKLRKLPEGCSCGVSEHNALLDQCIAAHVAALGEVARLTAELAAATARAGGAEKHMGIVSAQATFLISDVRAFEDALAAFFAEQSPDHEDDCPKDDTCECDDLRALYAAGPPMRKSITRLSDAMRVADAAFAALRAGGGR